MKFEIYSHKPGLLILGDFIVQIPFNLGIGAIFLGMLLNFNDYFRTWLRACRNILHSRS